MPLTPEEQHDYDMLKAHFEPADGTPVANPDGLAISATPFGQKQNYQTAQDIGKSKTLKVFDAAVDTSKSKDLKDYEVKKDVEKNLETENNKTLDPTAASRKAMLENAQQNLDTVNKVMLNPDGTVNDVAAFTARNNIPWTKGSQANNALQNAISAQLRAETGAGAPASEIEEMSKRFTPSIWDSEGEQKQKLTNLQRLINGTYTNMLPKLQQRNIATPAAGAAITSTGPVDYREYFKQ